DYVDQADLAAVAGQTGIDLGLQVVIDAFVQRTILVDHRHLGVRRLDGQLAAHAVGSVVDYGIFEERLADRVDPGREAGQPNGGVFRLLLTRLAVGDAGFRIGRTRLGDENADADALGVLLAQQLSQIVFGSLGNGDGTHGNSSRSCGRLYAK